MKGEATTEASPENAHFLLEVDFILRDIETRGLLAVIVAQLPVPLLAQMENRKSSHLTKA